MILFALRVVVILVVILASTPVFAQSICGQRDVVITRLADKYGETQQGRGIAGPSMIIELFVNQKTGTWTLVRSTPGAITCLITSGDNWQKVKSNPIRKES